jgi:uncharacterized protein (UPF0216 family)
MKTILKIPIYIEVVSDDIDRSLLSSFLKKELIPALEENILKNMKIPKRFLSQLRKKFGVTEVLPITDKDLIYGSVDRDYLTLVGRLR